MLLNPTVIPPAKNYLLSNVNSAKVENPELICIHLIDLDWVPTISLKPGYTLQMTQ